MKETTKPIDFVLPWVDGSDSQWQARFAQYAGLDGDSQNIRFRNWDLLRYWFRSIEKYAPWFRHIYFITSGELPEWLNLNHPRLRWIKHEDYVPAEYLPTFSANTIEMNLHRIEGLSEQFVYFNDDTFITKPVEESLFFYKDLPCDGAIMTARPVSGGIIHMVINDLGVLDRHFDKHRTIKKNPFKWFNYKYGRGLVSNLLLYPWVEFSGFIDPHMPNAFLKSTLTKIWENEPDLLNQTCQTKFRTNNDVNQWLIRYWQLAEGNFHPVNRLKGSLCTDISDENKQSVCAAIVNQQYTMLCLNDSDNITDFETLKLELQNSFEAILPQKSVFEK
ncbi:Stealth CR1 domain-containing protein [Viscerimonas tarda]